MYMCVGGIVSSDLSCICVFGGIVSSLSCICVFGGIVSTCHVYVCWKCPCHVYRR